MGKWSHSEYEKVLADKVQQLFEHAIGNIEKRDLRNVPDRRFRSFIKHLDPNNKHIQEKFEQLVLDQLFPRTYRLPPTSTSMGPSGLPISDSLPPIRTRPIVGLRRENRVLPVRRQTIIDFGRSNTQVYRSPSPASLSGARNIHSTESGDLSDFRINRDGSIEPLSPPTAASRAWLEDLSRTQNENYGQSNRDPARRIRSINGRRAHAPIFHYDSDATSVPDDFDTLLDRQDGEGSGNRIIGRRRRREESTDSDVLDGDIRRTRTGLRQLRRRLDREGNMSVPEYDRLDPFPNLFEALPGLLPWSPPLPSSNLERDLNDDLSAENRDRRRDGVVFDDPAIDNFLASIASPEATVVDPREQEGGTIGEVEREEREVERSIPN
ncbi:uncharacterized protein I206_100873 [Kwoniella pini CBS 10737]|uniref:Uncharacterized protein n=1 Tax=Kwoniella pini CBS 10737 TaxID=1296096 RepID=A0AAJ8MLW3_9TREE